MIVLNSGHLRRILSSYTAYYNRARTHLSLSKDAPDKRAIQLPEEGSVREIEHLGGLHHEYVRLAA
jgi:hypothetical protein